MKEYESFTNLFNVCALIKTRKIRLSKSEEVSNHFIQQLKCINFIMKVSQININQNLIDKIQN